jgi:predicted membrane channel-forming protein YqfA (hemolysin III family)
MKKYYWLMAGALVGAGTLVLSFVIPAAVFGVTFNSSEVTSTNWINTFLVILGYAVVIYLLSLGEKLLKK